MSVKQLVLDTWASISYKAPFQLGDGRSALFTQGWMSDQDKRRLTAYMVYEAYCKNRAAHFLDAEQRKDHREYGDAALIVKEALAALLGKSQTIVVDGADKYDPDLVAAEPETDDEGQPVVPDPDAEPDPNAPTDEELADNARAGAAADAQQWLRDWAKDEKLATKMHQCERTAVKSGDGVYLMAWSPSKKRARLTVMDPGFYFPVLPDTMFDDYPDRVHFAWIIPGDPGQSDKLRRITFELAAVTFDTEARPVGIKGQLRRLLKLDPVTGAPVLQAGDRYDVAKNAVSRVYAWSKDPSTVTCYLTDATWTMHSDTLLNDLDITEATFARNEEGELLERFDLHLDFLPVIHVPNTPAGNEHFGESVLAPVLQVLDDVAASDTDGQSASATAGKPIIGLAGATVEKGRQLKPGEIFQLGESGSLSTVDTSAALGELRQTSEQLRDNLSVNSRLPAAFLGRVTPAEVPSGFALALGFTPLDGLVDEMRLVRSEKNPLILRFAQKMAMGAGELPAGELWDATIELGAYLPANVQEVITQVTALRGTTPPLISLETAIGMLIDAGVPIDDVADEIARIEKADLESANKLADVVGSKHPAVTDRLGLPPAEESTVIPALPQPLPLPDDPNQPPA